MTEARIGLPTQLGLLAALSLADGLATHILVAAGISAELNPFMAPYVRNGLPAIFAAKLAAWTAVAIGLILLQKRGLEAQSRALARAAIWLYALLGTWHSVLLTAAATLPHPV